MYTNAVNSSLHSHAVLVIRIMTRDQAKERIGKLRKEINYNRYLYHVLDRQEISEEALDSLKHELAKLEKQFPDLVTPDSPTQRVAGKPLAGFKKVSHTIPLRSLNDVFSLDELWEWEKRVEKIVPQKFDYFVETKIDGFAISLIYQNGLLKTAATRGNGITGEDVTENIKTIESVPLELHSPMRFSKEKEVKQLLESFPRVKKAVAKIPSQFEVRGEVYLTKQSFEAMNKEQVKRGLPLFANPRNAASGSVRQLDPKITASRRLDFLAYAVVTDIGQETHEEEHAIAKLFGFKTAEPSRFCRNTEEIQKFWQEILKKREKLPFLIDGIVAQVNSRSLFGRLGVAGKAPRGAIAFKFPGKEATTVVKDIIVQVGRTGTLTPVAILEPVEVGGVTVSRATLHNMDEIRRLDVRIGDTAIVQRAGDVIPDIVRVLKNLRPKHAKEFHMPYSFCGQSVVRKEGEVAHRIVHPEECSLVTSEKFYHFVSRKAFDMRGLGPKIIDRLLDEKLVTTPADLFLLREGDIKPLERFAEKSAQNLVSSIQSRKEVELPRFIFALGILHVGEETAIDLAEHFGSLQKLVSASAKNLMHIPNLGPVAAKSINKWFKNPENRKFVEKFLEVGVRIKSHRPKIKGGKLRGLTFVLTGGLGSVTRDEAKARVRELGGDVSESVSKKTDYVVVGTGPGSKLERAKKLGAKIIDEKELLRLLR